MNPARNRKSFCKAGLTTCQIQWNEVKKTQIMLLPQSTSSVRLEMIIWILWCSPSGGFTFYFFIVANHGTRKR